MIEAITGVQVINLSQYGVLGLALITMIGVVRYLYTKLEKETDARLAEAKVAADARLDELRRAHDTVLTAKNEQLAQLSEDKRLLQRTNDEATLFMRDRLVPAIADSTRIIAEYVEILRRRGSSGGQ